MHICMAVFTELSSDYRVFRAATALRKAGHEVSIVAGADGTKMAEVWDPFDILPIEVDRRASLRVAYPRFWRRARQAMTSVRADAYHAHDLDTLWPAARAAASRGAALVYDSHELWTEQASLALRPLMRGFWRLFEGRLVRRANRIIAVSPAIAQILERRHQPAAPVVVIRNLPPFKQAIRSDRIRAELGIDRSRLVILYQGGFLTDNGLSEQIESMAAVEGAALVLLGDGPMEPALRRRVAAAGLEDRVHFLPRVPFHALHEFTCSADLGLCLIKPSGRSFELSLPNKLFEYFMAGIPVLAGDTPEIRRVIEATGAGEVTAPADVGAISASLRKLIDDEPRRLAYREAALRAAAEYNWELEAPKLVELYNAL